MFDFDISDELKLIIMKLVKKTRKSRNYKQKIKEIINCDNVSINHYKNLRYDLKEFKKCILTRILF